MMTSTHKEDISSITDELARHTMPIGIDRMVVTSPSYAITARNLGLGITANNMKKMVIEVLDEKMREAAGNPGAMEELSEMRKQVSGLYALEDIRKATKALLTGNLMTLEELSTRLDTMGGRISIRRGKEDELRTATDGLERRREVERLEGWIDKMEIPEGKIVQGFGIKEIRLPGYSESNVTFVADAIYRFVKDIGNNEQESKHFVDHIKAIFYSTESNSDRSKPDVQIALQLVMSKLLADDERKYRPFVEALKRVRPTPITYACVGGVISLDSSLDKIKAVMFDKREATCLVITGDTAVYDSRTAAGAEVTQGAASTLMYIKRNPRLAEIHQIVEGASGSFNESFFDFTKFFKATPFVHGKFSEFIYIFAIAKAFGRHGMREIFREISQEKLDFYLSHPPFPKQLVSRASFDFVEYMKLYDKKGMKELEAAVGREPLPKGVRSIVQYIDKRLYLFNRKPARGGDMSEDEQLHCLQEDKNIIDYMKWLGEVRKTPQFARFTERLLIASAIELPSRIGNSYSSSVFVSLASLMQSHIDAVDRAARGGVAEMKRRLKGVVAGYGSGSHSQLFSADVVAECRPEDNCLRIGIDLNRVEIGPEEYVRLHENLLEDDSMRLISAENLIEKDTAKLLRGESMPEGFRIYKRNQNGSGEYAYVKDGIAVPLPIRH